MNRHSRLTIFEGKTFLMSLPWQLAFFSHGHQAGSQLVSGSGGKDKPTRVDTHASVYLGVSMFFNHQVDGSSEEARFAQYGGNVFKLNARFWEIRHITDGGFKIAGGD